MYNRQILTHLKSRFVLKTVVGKYIKLKKKTRSGKRRKVTGYKGLCPFHNEKTPSFSLYQLKSYGNTGTWGWKCFGCGQSGDVFRFVEIFEDVDFSQAFKLVNETMKYPSRKSKKNQLSIPFPETPPLIQKPEREFPKEAKGIRRTPDYFQKTYHAPPRIREKTDKDNDDSLPF